MQIAHGAEIAHIDAAAAVERAVEPRLPRHESRERLAIRRVEVRDLTNLPNREAELAQRTLSRSAQIDRETDAEAKQQLQMGIAQMFDRGLQVAARQML